MSNMVNPSAHAVDMASKIITRCVAAGGESVAYHLALAIDAACADYREWLDENGWVIVRRDTVDPNKLFDQKAAALEGPEK